MSQKNDYTLMINDQASEDAISMMEWSPGSPESYLPLLCDHESLSNPTYQNEVPFGDLNTPITGEATIPLSGTGVAQMRGPGPLGQFRKHLTKPLVPFLTMVYLCAESILQTARSVQVFHMQSLYLARQALHLVILLNDLVDPEEGPDNTQQMERIALEDDLIELLEAMEEWGARGDGGSLDCEQRLLQIQHHYTQIFKGRFYYHDARDATRDLIYEKLVAYDERTIEKRRRYQFKSPIVEAECWIGQEESHVDSVEEPDRLPVVFETSTVTVHSGGSTSDMLANFRQNQPQQVNNQDPHCPARIFPVPISLPYDPLSHRSLHPTHSSFLTPALIMSDFGFASRGDSDSPLHSNFSDSGPSGSLPPLKPPGYPGMSSDYDAYDAILHYIFKQTQGEAWFKPQEEFVQAGVALRTDVNPARFRIFPYENFQLAPFEAAVRGLNPLVAVKIRSAAVHAALTTVSDTDTSIAIDVNSRIQILDTMAQLPRADKEQSAAFIRDECCLVCWSSNLDHIIPTCQEIDRHLAQLLWSNRPHNLQSPYSSLPTGRTPSLRTPFDNILLNPNATSGAPSDADEKRTLRGGRRDAGDEESNEKRAKVKKSFFGWKAETKERDIEADKPAIRPTRLFAPVYNGLGASLFLCFMGMGNIMLLEEYWLDHNPLRFALVVTIPFLFCVSISFAIAIVGILIQSIRPVAQYQKNSKYYSAIKPAANPAIDNHLPHITIQMPVYKESLKETIAPSCESLKRAMQTYAQQGGTSNIMICDDGMQIIDATQAAERRAYYAEHGIGWIARPGHSSAPDGFKRAGRFKKASNMNYALKISLKLEEHLARFMNDDAALSRARAASHFNRALKLQQPAGQNEYGEEMSGWTNALAAAAMVDANEDDEDGEEALEDLALHAAIDEVYEETGNRFKPWGENGRALRCGEIILIVDSATIVPEDCLRDAAREMADSPEVGVIQHESDVMQVAHTYFENGIAHFTRRINHATSFAAANGEVAAFVGHNAFLRWKAIQDVAFIDPADGERKIWSESNVSEDFDMALRLQLGGYIVRWASYSDGGFKEGVSLTEDDEINRWEKYAYGCSELIFNPFVQWSTKGPITAQLHNCVWSNAPVHYKVSMMAYMFSYYGIAASFTLVLLNYLLFGWQLSTDGYYLCNVEIWIGISFLFPICGNISYSILEYRLGHNGLIASFIKNVMWVPFFLFFKGLS